MTNEIENETRIRYDQKAIIEAVNTVLNEYEARLTVRQIYYRLISPPYQLFPNSHKSYKRFVGILTRAREDGTVDWTRIEDRARHELFDYGPKYGSVIEYIDDIFNTITARYYDRNRWAMQPRYIEVWVEKDALSRLFVDAATEYEVMVCPSRGNSSLTKVMEAISRFPKDKEIVILHFTDHDPSGLMMTQDLIKRFGSYTDRKITVKRVGLTKAQIDELSLASNPTKASDNNTPGYVAQYGDECWELDALPYGKLSEIVSNAIKGEVDQSVWDRSTNRIAFEKGAITDAIEAGQAAIDQAKALIKGALDEGVYQ